MTSFGSVNTIPFPKLNSLGLECDDSGERGGDDFIVVEKENQKENELTDATGGTEDDAESSSEGQESTSKTSKFFEFIGLGSSGQVVEKKDLETRQPESIDLSSIVEQSHSGSTESKTNSIKSKLRISITTPTTQTNKPKPLNSLKNLRPLTTVTDNGSKLLTPPTEASIRDEKVFKKLDRISVEISILRIETEANRCVLRKLTTTIEELKKINSTRCSEVPTPITTTTTQIKINSTSPSIKAVKKVMQELKSKHAEKVSQGKKVVPEPEVVRVVEVVPEVEVVGAGDDYGEMPPLVEVDLNGNVIESVSSLSCTSKVDVVDYKYCLDEAKNQHHQELMNSIRIHRYKAYRIPQPKRIQLPTPPAVLSKPVVEPSIRTGVRKLAIFGKRSTEAERKKMFLASFSKGDIKESCEYAGVADGATEDKTNTDTAAVKRPKSTMERLMELRAAHVDDDQSQQLVKRPKSNVERAIEQRAIRTANASSTSLSDDDDHPLSRAIEKAERKKDASKNGLNESLAHRLDPNDVKLAMLGVKLDRTDGKVGGRDWSELEMID